MKSNTYLDENGNCHWKITHYSPNPISALIVLLLFAGLFLFFYAHVGWDSSLWFMIALLLLYSFATLVELYKFFFRSYIVEVVFYEEEIVLHYRKGESRSIPYTGIGFVDFQLHDGVGSRIRFYPHFTFYKENSTSKILDSVYRGDYLLFTGELSSFEDYLRIKKCLEEKEKRFFEPRETEECFKRSRLTRKARRDAGV
mgnify:FL=1